MPDIDISNVDPAEINFNDLDTLVDRVPHDWFAWLRRNAPVFRNPDPGGPGFWVITRYEDVVAVGRNHRLFSNAPSHVGLGAGDEFVRIAGGQNRLSRQARGERPGDDSAGSFLLTLDPPEHTTYRTILNRDFTPRRVRALEGRTRELTRSRIRAVIERGECDVVVDVAMPLPLEVICELLSVPREDHEQICTWSNQVMGSVDPEYQESGDTIIQAFNGFYDYLDKMAEKKRSHPADDIVGKLVASGIPPSRYRAYLLLLFVAGNETTRNAITHGMHAFMMFPEQRRRLIEHPEMIDLAVEEVLRWASPVYYMRRRATERTEIRGVRIDEGDLVSIWYTSANYDDEVFADPYTFDIGRDPNDHIAFGGGGRHFCLGAHLARLEIKVVLQELMRWMPDMEQTDKPLRLRNNHINGIKHLPVRFTPRSPAEVG